MLEFLRQSHTALFEITKRLAARLSDALRHLNAAEKAKAEEKIMHTLYFLSLRFGHLDHDNDTAREIALPVTHQDIANLLGLTRETVTVELKNSKNKGSSATTNPAFSCTKTSSKPCYNYFFLRNLGAGSSCFKFHSWSFGRNQNEDDSEVSYQV